MSDITISPSKNPLTLEEQIKNTPKSYFKPVPEQDLEELPPNYIDLYEYGVKFIYENFGYIVEPDASKTHNAFLGVYSVGSAPEGVVCPDYVKLKYPLFNGERQKWNRQINRMYYELGRSEYGELVQKFWQPFFFENESGAIERFVSAEMNAQASAITSLKDNRPYDQGICINPVENMDEYPRAIVPHLDWFDKEIQDLQPEDICTLFPKDELLIFMLVVGRALIGRNGSKLINGPVVNHMFRKMAILYGEDGGTGKSYFKNLLISTMAKYGYTIAQPLNLNSRFNQYSNYKSDLSVTDDLTQKSMDNFITGQAFKSLITGTSTLGTEAKGKDRIDVLPTCALMAITNTFDQNSIYHLDSGAIDRLSVLYTYTHDELASRQESDPDKHDYKPYNHIKYLMKKYQCNEHVLMGRFMRHCIDLFWDKYEKGELEEFTTKTSANLRFPYVTEVVPNMMEAARLAHLLKRERSVSERTNKFYNVKGFQQVMYDYFWLVGSGSVITNRLRNLIKKDWIDHGKPSKHPWKGIRLINKYSLLAANAHVNTNASDISINDLQKLVFDQLKDNDGTKIGAAPKYINSGYSAACCGLKGRRLVRLSNKVRKQIKEDEKIKTLGNADDIIQNEVLSLEYAKDSSYDPYTFVQELDKQYDKIEV